MIAIICAMSEERDALLSIASDIKVVKIDAIRYHGMAFDNKCYKAFISNKEVIIAHCGVGKAYAAIVTTIIIKKFKPELIINVGCAGSLNAKIHVGDVVIASRVGDWDVDVPGWNRSIISDKMSYACDGRFSKLIKNEKFNFKVVSGSIVSSDQFVYRKSQLNIIKKYFPEALCAEMEGSSIASASYAFGINCAIIRSISDETLVNGNYKNFDFNLQKACKNAATICEKILMRY